MREKEKRREFIWRNNDCKLLTCEERRGSMNPRRSRNTSCRKDTKEPIL